MQTRGGEGFKPGFTGLTAFKPGYPVLIMIVSARRAAGSVGLQLGPIGHLSEGVSRGP